MKKKLLKPIITNEKMVALLAILVAVFMFGFWRIMLYNPGFSFPGNFKNNIGTEGAIISENDTQSTGLTNPNQTIKIPILMYHHVGELPKNADKLRKGLTVTTEDFELQVAWLKGQGYESLSLNDFLQLIKNNQPLPEKPVIFTFDDGYDDALTNAPKILKQYGFTGDFGIITQFVGITLGNNSYASWQDIRQAKAMGMEIISHTQDHFDGTNKKYTDNFILTNLKNSQKDIKDNLGVTFPILIYPFGHYDTSYIKLAREAGFEMGITTHESKNVYSKKLMEIPRVRISGGQSLESFKRAILE